MKAFLQDVDDVVVLGVDGKALLVHDGDTEDRTIALLQ